MLFILKRHDVFFRTVWTKQTNSIDDLNYYRSIITFRPVERENLANQKSKDDVIYFQKVLYKSTRNVDQGETMAKELCTPLGR